MKIDFSATFDSDNNQGILLIKGLLRGYWGFCVVYIDTVSIKSITACYGRG